MKAMTMQGMVVQSVLEIDFLTIRGQIFVITKP